MSASDSTGSGFSNNNLDLEKTLLAAAATAAAAQHGSSFPTFDPTAALRSKELLEQQATKLGGVNKHKNSRQINRRDEEVNNEDDVVAGDVDNRDDNDDENGDGEDVEESIAAKRFKF